MQSARYFAVWGDDFLWCGCGDSAEFLEADDKPLGECNTTCPGNHSETCGGGSSYSLYEILESTDCECCTGRRAGGEWVVVGDV